MGFPPGEFQADDVGVLELVYDFVVVIRQAFQLGRILCLC